jgi:hypothetical protein
MEEKIFDPELSVEVQESMILELQREKEKCQDRIVEIDTILEKIIQ